MTEPNNDSPLHESVRERLANYHPPFDPGNWQRMRQKLQRDRWRLLAWRLTGILWLLGIGWYIGSRESIPPVLHRPVAITQKTPSIPSPTAPIVRPDVTTGKLLSQQPGRKTAAVKLVFQQPTAPKPEANPLPMLPVHPAALAVQPPGLPSIVVHSPAETDIVRRVTTGDIGTDSTTYRVLSRNLTHWPNAVIVCDFTSSMYPYSTQLLTWFQQNESNRQVQGIVFFTDCDSLGREVKPGQSGQVFTTRSRSVDAVLPLMLASARNTMGNRENAENNIDPLAYAQRQFPQADHLILVADNSSRVKDLSRLPELHKPVHVILCGPTYDTTRAFQPDYYALARQTNGSLHTLDDDLTNVESLHPNTWIRVDERYYRLNRRGRFVPTNFRHRPKRLLGLFWR